MQVSGYIYDILVFKLQNSKKPNASHRMGLLAICTRIYDVHEMRIQKEWEMQKVHLIGITAYLAHSFPPDFNFLNHNPLISLT